MKYQIIIIFTLMISCKDTQINSEKSKSKITISESATYSLKVDSETDYKFIQTEVLITDSGTMFFAYDRNQKYIYLFDLYNDSLLLKTKVKNEGADSFNQLPYSFKIISKDSLICLQQQPIVFYRMNIYGEIIEKLEINEKLPNGIENPIAGSGITDPLIYDQKSNSISFWVMYATSPLLHYSSQNSAIFNLSSKKYTSIFLYYPNEYENAIKENMWYGNKENLIRIKVNKKLIYSYQISNSLYIYNFGSETESDTVCAKSKFIDKPIESIPFNSNIQEETNNFNTEPNYVNLIYDKYRKIYLRVVKHKQDLRNSNGELNQYLNSEWSIIFLDDEFKLIDEIKFEQNKYNFKDIFIVKEGFLISTNNPFNPNEKEGILQFQKYIINKI